MTQLQDLDRLCQLYGIALEYTDIWRRSNPASADTKRALLASMGVTVNDEAALQAALSARERRGWLRLLPPVRVVTEATSPILLVLTLPQHRIGEVLSWTLRLENGETHSGELSAAVLEKLESNEIDGVVYGRYGFALPARPPCGYHRFELNTADGKRHEHGDCTLIITPDRCYQPPALEAGGRLWGPTVQLYALRSQRNWGIGDFTDLRLLMERAAELGASVVGVNPLHALFPHNPEHASPYSPSSRLFLNVLYIDVEAIADYAECEAARLLVSSPSFQERIESVRRAELVRYAEIASLKFSVLERLYAHFREHHLATDSERAKAFRAFQHARGDALHRHALYETLQEHFHRSDPDAWGWPVWPEPYRHPESPEVSAFAAAHRERLQYFEYLQWIADSQLAAVGHRALALGVGVGLYQDLAVGIDRAGAEAWAHQELYALTASVGSPPDDYSLSGQDWGLPPLIPDALVESAYAPFIATLRENMGHSGALRIDHVMGLLRLFWVPPDGKPAHGAYVHYAFADLCGILALESQRNRCMVIGEDLGTVPDEVPAALHPLRVLSYRLFYFEKDDKGELKAPAQYPEQALVAVTTHDLPTLAGFWQGQELLERTELELFPSEEARDQQLLARIQDRARLLLALERERLLPAGVTVDPASSPQMTPALIQAVHRYIARSPCQLMLVQLEDVIGQQYQVNLPGTTDQRPNWRYRLALDMEQLLDGARMHELVAAIRQERGLEPKPVAAPVIEPIIPAATYRLQFNRDFTFTQATELVPYFQRLGISHCYASPYLKARAGSTHGYDIVDHNALNPEIGSADDYERFVDSLQRHGMSQILDIVPNHMGVGGDDNAWWLDVLENGQASAYAGFFDIDWRPAKDEMRGKVLLPVLGEHYGTVLESGELKLVFDVEQGTLSVRYYGHLLPIDPRTYADVLSYRPENLEQTLGRDDIRLMEYQSLVTAFRNLPGRDRLSPERLEERRRDQSVHKRQLVELCGRCREIRQFIEENVALFNGTVDDPTSFDALHALLEQQAYRLAHWRVATDEINYRRFFDINDLAGLRMENPQVFALTHRLILDLIARNRITGLRIDHPDGLHDPAQYYRRLQASVVTALSGESSAVGPTRAIAIQPNARPLYIVVEKILATYEHLPENWPVFGTTGYDFVNLVNGLFIYAPAERVMNRIYRRFTDRDVDFDELLYERKKLIMRVSLSSELTVLANQLDHLSESDRHTRDFTWTALRDALLEVVACFPVYRTYVSADQVTTEDKRYVEWAIAQAKKRSPAVDVSIFDFVRDILLLNALDMRAPDYQRAATEFAMRFQQYTSPVMAKGLEDTSFYIYNRLVSLNEVGGDPRRFGVSLAAFHHANQERARRWPHAMLATSTHDSKRGEDVRARINVLSEVVDEWWQRLKRWRRLNRSKKRKVNDEPAPSANDEYLLYQTLVGAWPLGEIDEAGLTALAQRIEAYMLKAMKEAKVHTSWINPNSEYEQAAMEFVRVLLSSPQNNPFLADFVPFQRRVSRLGMFNALSEVLLKFTVPGVPDIYQGNELWDFSLVDPDNRRPVDYAHRQRLLQQLEKLTAVADSELAPRVRALLDTMEDGRVKLYLTWQALELRGQYPQVFRDGSYTPLEVYGPRAEHLCAFARLHEQNLVIAVAPRWFARLSEDTQPPLGPAVWQDTFIRLPSDKPANRYCNILTGEQLSATESEDKVVLAVADVLANFPVALLTKL